ncbi:MAG: YceI family protein [Helicobacter sp.]|nr:YceI family protein [Helicobacter sp.]
MKFFLAMVLGASFLSATSINTESVKVFWGGYKTPKKVEVNGSFSDVKFKFGKNKNTLTQALENATATIDPMSATIGDDELKTSNIREYFFSKFDKDKKEIKVTLKNVVEGENVGTILAVVKMNGKTQKVPMKYTIEGHTFKAWGTLDLSEFKLDAARENLQKAVADLHENLTWSQVKIGFEAHIAH